MTPQCQSGDGESVPSLEKDSHKSSMASTCSLDEILGIFPIANTRLSYLETWPPSSLNATATEPYDHLEEAIRKNVQPRAA